MAEIEQDGIAFYEKPTKLTNFAKAVNRLMEGVQTYGRSEDIPDLLRDGLIQRFELTYELAWKAAKEHLENVGIRDKTSPKSVLRESFAQGLISDEDTWLLMISDRNPTIHIYDESIAIAITDRIIGLYAQAFSALLQKLMDQND